MIVLNLSTFLQAQSLGWMELISCWLHLLRLSYKSFNFSYIYTKYTVGFPLVLNIMCYRNIKYQYYNQNLSSGQVSLFCSRIVGSLLFGFVLRSSHL